MSTYKGRVALVTGASSGIGSATCEILVKNGLKVVGAARRLDKLEELSKSVASYDGDFVPYQCDITVDEQVYALFHFIKEKYGGLDVSINNAGRLGKNGILDGTPKEWREIFELNVVALTLCSKLAVESMKQKGIDDGFIINVGSVCSHNVFPVKALHVYDASKFAVRAVTTALRQEIKERKSGIRVSLLCPGLVRTEMTTRPDNGEDISSIISKTAALTADNMAVIILQMLNQPLGVEINDVVVTPTNNFL